jgi:molecular chaperone DnaJ
MMAKRDYYEILQVDRGAGAEEIKKSYRKIALACHPDRNPGDPEAEARFKEASEAYAVLSDPQKRHRYDQFGHQGVGPASGAGAGFTAGGFADVFSDLFSDIFGNGQRGTGGGAQGEDLRYRLRLTLEQAAAGMEKSITFPRLEECERCLGDGVEPGHSPAPCRTCGGRGEVRYQQAFFTMARTCPHCAGRGRIVEHPCRSCRGEGRKKQERTLTVTVPPGVRDGTRLRLRGEGDAGHGRGHRGDLFVVTEVEEHSLFARDGDNLVCDVPIRLEDAVLGAEMPIPTLDGPIPFKVPEGTQAGQVFHLKGKGMPRLQGAGRGDLYVRVLVEVPRKLSRKQKELLKALSGELGEGAYPQVREFRKKAHKVAGP